MRSHTRSPSTLFQSARAHTHLRRKIFNYISDILSKNAPLADHIDFASCRRVNTKLNGVRTVLMFTKTTQTRGTMLARAEQNTHIHGHATPSLATWVTVSLSLTHTHVLCPKLTMAEVHKNILRFIRLAHDHQRCPAAQCTSSFSQVNSAAPMQKANKLKSELTSIVACKLIRSQACIVILLQTCPECIKGSTSCVMRCSFWTYTSLLQASLLHWMDIRCYTCLLKVSYTEWKSSAS